MSRYFLRGILRPTKLAGLLPTAKFCENPLKEKFLQCRTYTDGSASEYRREMKSLIEGAYPIVQENMNLLNKKFSNIDREVEWLKKVMDYNTHQSRHYCLLIFATYMSSADPELLTPENIKWASIYGMAYETVITKCGMMDDIIDESESRNNRKSWYHMDDIKLSAVYDATVMLEYALMIFKQFSSQRDIYYDFLKRFHSMLFGTYLAEYADSRHKPYKFSQNLYDLTADIKSQNSIVCAVDLGMMMAGITNEKAVVLTEQATAKMARLFQTQNDFDDCYQPTRKGTDILRGQVSWLCSMALKKANEEQKKLLIEHYGNHIPESVKIVEQLYQDLDIETEFYKHLKKTLREIEELVDQLPEKTPKLALNVFLQNFRNTLADKNLL